MEPQQLSAIVLTIGAAIGIIASLMPINTIYRIQDVAKRIETINARRKEYDNHNNLFVVSAFLTGVGLVMVSLLLSETDSSMWGWIGAALAVIGTYFMIWVMIARKNHPAGETFLPERLFWIFHPAIYLTHGALLAYGFAYLQTGLVPTWVAWVHIIGMALVLGYYLVRKDALPQTYIAVSLLAGITLF